MLHRAATAVLSALVLFAAACAVPLGPGFHTEKELLEVRFVPGAPPHLQVRATFTLKNSGNAPLDSLDLSLPGEKDFGAQNLRITVDGAAIAAQPLADAAPGAANARIVFSAPWPQKARRTLVVSYDLRAASSPAMFAIAENSFSLPAASWYPLLRAPNHLFAKGDAPPARFDLSVFVPQDFLVHAAGQPRGKKRRSPESEFRFRIREDDFSPFVIAGHYHEQKFSASNFTIFFWTFQPLPADQVARAGPRLAATAQILEKLFGPIVAGKRSSPLWIVETPNSPAQVSSGNRAAQLDSAPAVALLSSAAFHTGVTSENFLLRVERFWASSWPNFVVQPAPGAEGFLATSLTEYASLVADQARRGEPARTAFAGEFLRAYDAACRANEEIPIASLQQKDISAQQRIAESKLALFLLAAENEVGSESFHRALRRMIQGLRGRTYGFTDFRVALEAESGKDLGEFFRRWLNHPGIPADFRARYASLK